MRAGTAIHSFTKVQFSNVEYVYEWPTVCSAEKAPVHEQRDLATVALAINAHQLEQ